MTLAGPRLTRPSHTLTPRPSKSDMTPCTNGVQVFLQAHHPHYAHHRLAVLAYVAMTQDVLEEGKDRRRMYVSLFSWGIPLNSFHRGVYAALAPFLVFSMIQFRDGPFVRPHPAMWMAILGINLLYELALVFFSSRTWIRPEP